MEKRIELMPLAEIGHGFARVTENSVDIEVSGINGSMKAWLIGGEAVPIGNVVGGRLQKRISTRGHIGVLITQGGRQMLIGKFSNEKEEPVMQKHTEPESAPFSVEGFVWRMHTQKSYGDLSRELRFLLSNRAVYENFKKYGHCWIGEGAESGALALKCNEEEADPFSSLGKLKIRKNGYVIVCVDKKTNKLYIPD